MTAHTGDTEIIYQWFLDNPGKFVKPRDLATEFGLERWQVSNAIQHLVRRNRIKRGEKRGFYALRNDKEKREEFKVHSKAIVAQESVPLPPAPPTFPVFSGKVHPAIMPLIRSAIKENRVTILSATEAIVWNNSTQRQEMRRQMAFSH